MIKVLKFGGTSVGSIEKIKAIANFIANEQKQTKNQYIVITSAMGKNTDTLIAMLAKVSDNASKREYDRLISTGELQTIALMSVALQELGLNAKSLTGAQAGIKTTNDHQKAKISSCDKNKILAHLENNDVLVVAGFQGIDDHGDITTLGRGGSDTTAVALAAVLGVDAYIYTDVDGVYAADPRIVPLAKKLRQISYQEMMELSVLGSGVMENRSVQIAKKHNIAIHVRKTLSEDKGSKITSMENQNQSLFEYHPVTGVSVNDDIIEVQIRARECENSVSNYEILEAYTDKGINVDMITMANTPTHNDLHFTCDITSLEDVKNITKQVLREHKNVSVEIQTNNAMVSIVGIGMKVVAGVASRTFNVLKKHDINWTDVSTSEISMSIIVDETKAKLAVQLLCNEFGLVN